MKDLNNNEKLEDIKVDKICNKYKSRSSNSYTIASAILETICYMDKINKEIEAKEFSKPSFYEYSEMWSEIEDIYLQADNKKTKIQPEKEALRVLKCLKILINEKRKYKLSSDDLFDSSKYIIKDIIVLKNLMPLLLGYVSKISDKIPADFFQQLDYLINYISQYSEAHNKYFELEKKILNKLSEEVSLKTNNGIVKGVAENIIYKIENNDIRKYIQLSDNNEEKKDILLSSIIKIIDNNIDYQPNTNNLRASNYMQSNYEEENKPEEVKEIETINILLEVDSLCEYFDIKPFLKMTQYKTKEEIAELQTTTDLLPKSNKYYIMAEDDEKQIISTLFHTLPYVKILQAPQSLKSAMLKKFKIFSEKNNIDICKEFCTDSPPTSNKESTNENYDNDNSSSNITTNKDISGFDKYNQIKKDKEDKKGLDF